MKHKVLVMAVLFFIFFLNNVLSEQPIVNVTLRWVDPNPRDMQVVKYNIYQSIRKNAPFVLLTSSKTNFITLTNLKPSLYRWKVSAVNMWGEGPLSAEAQTPESAPLALTNILYNSISTPTEK